MNQNDFENLPKTEGQAPAKVKEEPGNLPASEESDDEKIKRLTEEVRTKAKSKTGPKSKIGREEVNRLKESIKNEKIEKLKKKIKEVILRGEQSKITQDELNGIKEFEGLSDDEKIEILKIKAKEAIIKTGFKAKVGREEVSRLKKSAMELGE